MGSKLAIHPLTEEEYLSRSEYEHCEYIDGEAVELNLGTKHHSRIQSRCDQILGNFLMKIGVGTVHAELRCRLIVQGRRRFYLPDVCVIVHDDDPDARYQLGAPDFVIEVRSPDDRIPVLKKKIQDYLDNGCRLAWLIIPEERSVLVYRPDAPMRVVQEGDTLDLDGVLPGHAHSCQAFCLKPNVLFCPHGFEAGDPSAHRRRVPVAKRIRALRVH